MPKRILDPNAPGDPQPGTITDRAGYERAKAEGRIAELPRAGALRVCACGSYRSVADPAWGVNFGPESDVDQAIPGSGGVTLRQLKDAGEIAADCFCETADERPSSHQE